jgi:hypothetical protein
MKFIENFNLSIVGERRKKIKIRNRKKIISSNNNSSIEKQKFVIGLRKNSTSNNSNLN